MKKNLVIVESPAKSKTLSRFLGAEYNITACMGHIIDLPKSKMGVDIENNFNPQYRIIPRKKKVVKELKQKAKQHKNIYLAADPDREGESICWHLKNELSNGKVIYRVSFNEITKQAILEAFKRPRDIDMNKVNAQQARRILDRLVGYSLSPLLWKKVVRGLSAGRVQSVAVRLIVDREKEIEKFKPEEYWSLEVELYKEEKQKLFKAKLFRIDNKKFKLSSEKEVREIEKNLEGSQFIIDKIEKRPRRRFPRPPFTTSTLQQAAYNRYKFTASRTMTVAQQLYEGIELGNQEVTGLITYMRTDSVRISQQAIKNVRDLIQSEYGENYLPSKPKIYKSKKAAQEAHEAIRPTYPSKKPEGIREFLTKDQFKLYELIWQRFVASQMKPAEFDYTQVFIITQEYKNKYVFKTTGSKLKFEGYLRVCREEFEETELPDLREKEGITLNKIIPGQHFTKPPARYSESSLIKILEKEGVGRPSTYAPIIYTILERDYVRRQEGYLVPTELGVIVTELLVQHFPKILNTKFTAEMEKSLDLIEEGKKDRNEVLKYFYEPFQKNLELAKEKMENIKKKVIPTDQKCKECGADMIIKWGKWGKFLSCSRFPDCKYSETITTGLKCPEEGCDGELIQRRSRKRKIFYGCTNYPKCKFTTNKLPEEE